MVPHLHQTNGYIKRKLRVYRTQKCKAIVGAETVLSSAMPQTTPFHGGQYRVLNENMRKIGPTNPNGTVFAPKHTVKNCVFSDLDSQRNDVET